MNSIARKRSACANRASAAVATGGTPGQLTNRMKALRQAAPRTPSKPRS